jgi:hypothetical protein
MDTQKAKLQEHIIAEKQTIIIIRIRIIIIQIRVIA